jgi:hypothetical protein
MTEDEWLANSRPTGMLLYIRAKASARKSLLFECACCRNVWTLLDAEDRDAISSAESNSDNPEVLRELDSRLEPDRVAALSMAGLHDESVNENLARLLTGRTTIRLRLFGKGYAIGSVAFETARLSTLAEPRIAGIEGKPFISPSETGSEEKRQADLVRDIFDNPFRPVIVDPRWRTSDVLGLARAMYEARTFDRMPILADALMDAGCSDEQILSHCRGDGPHVRGCWVVDLVLGKE